MDDEKIEAVLRYLRVHFPGREMKTAFDGGTDTLSCKVSLPGGQTHLVKLAREVCDDASADMLPNLLDRYEVGEAMERSKGQGVLVTRAGVTCFERN